MGVLLITLAFRLALSLPTEEMDSPVKTRTFSSQPCTFLYDDMVEWERQGLSMTRQSWGSHGEEDLNPTTTPTTSTTPTTPTTTTTTSTTTASTETGRHCFWRRSRINHDYSLSPSYPPTVIVPSSISDDTLRQSASFRAIGRIPVLTYRHILSGAVLCRGCRIFFEIRKYFSFEY